MTPFAQLEEGAGLEKAARGAFFKGLHNVVRDGIWKTLSNTAQKDHTGIRALGNKASRLFYNPAAKGGKGARTWLSKGLTGYGFGGMIAPAFGVSLPGSTLAFNTVMPGMGALFSAPGAITSARMASSKNQQRLQDDVMHGARSAAGDLITLAHQHPQITKKRGLYSEYLRHTSPELADMAENYRQGNYKPMGGWQTAGSIFMDPQKLINDKVDQRIFSMMKSGSFGAVARGIGKGFKNVFPWTFPALGVGMVGHSLLRDKPYDAAQAQSRGYAGASTRLQGELDNMSGLQRFLVGMDPSLMTRHIERKLPGTVAQWEQTHGRPYQPGFIGQLAGGVPGRSPDANVRYYQMDAAGQRHYL